MTKEKINELKTLGEYNRINNDEIIHYKTCPICGSKMLKTNHHTYCSDECKKKAEKNKFKNYPSFEQVTQKYDELKSWQKVAKFYGVTRKIIQGIRKRVTK